MMTDLKQSTDLQKPLGERMVQYADDHWLIADDPMRRLAQELDRAASAADGTAAQTRKFVGAWARARSHWCAVTGDMRL